MKDKYKDERQFLNLKKNSVDQNVSTHPSNTQDYEGKQPMLIQKQVADNQALFINKTFQIKQNIQRKYCLRHFEMTGGNCMNQVAGQISIKNSFIQGNKNLPFTRKIEQKS